MNLEILTDSELMFLTKYLEHLKRYGIPIDKGLQHVTRFSELRKQEKTIAVSCLVQLIQQYGTTDGGLDELVHDTADEMAAETNNAGLEGQLNWLLDQGCAPGYILEQLGIRPTRMATAG